MLWIAIGTLITICALFIALLRRRPKRRPATVDAASGGAIVADIVTALKEVGFSDPSATPETEDDALERTFTGKYHVRYLADPAEENRSPESENRLLEARRVGVTGTDARKLVRLDGTPSNQRARLMEERLSGIIRDHAASGAVARKPAIAALLEREFSIEYNTMLCVGSNLRHLATPDGIGDGVIAEIKVSSKTWEQTARAYRDELQWQLHVTGSEKVLLAVEHRHSRLLHHGWIERDEQRIARLAEHADLFLRDLDERRGVAVEETPVASGFESEPQLQFELALELDKQLEPVFRAGRHASEPHPEPDLETDFALDDEASANQESESGSIEPDREEVFFPDHREWSTAESARLVDAYSQGRSLISIAQEFDVRLGPIVHELARWVLGAQAPLVDRQAPRHGALWTEADAEAAAAYRDGDNLRSLAEQLGRDQLSVAFQLLSARRATVPEETLELLMSDAFESSAAS